MPIINCLQQVVRSGNHEYPIFIGFLAAADILQIAEAPQFTEETPNHEIASNMLNPPVKDWQRPLIKEKVKEIVSLFDNTGQFMPNPVLLCENVLKQADIGISQQKAYGNVLTGVWEVEIPLPKPNQEKPLWILDGQHRIHGMSSSLQSENQVPIVLLLNQGGVFYSGTDLAKIFAQVTTAATKLDPLHNEWLTYAFDLGVYSDNSPNHEEHESSLKCVAHLCQMPKLGNEGINNPFMNNIRFSQYRESRPAPGGFSYDCIELKQLVYKHYYNAATLAPRLSPRDLAIQLGLAHHALTLVVQAPQNQTVFFGGSDYGQKIIQDAFLAGVMSHLLHNGKPHEWKDVLSSLAFDTTNWNFNTWVRSLSGAAQTISRKIAIEVFTSTFKSQVLPNNTSNLADYLKGDGASINLAFSYLTPAGKKSNKDQAEYQLPVGSRRSTTTGGRRHIKLSDYTRNIGQIVVTDMQSPPGRLVLYPEILGGGLLVDPTKHANPLPLYITMHHYGDNTSTSELEISW